jgi:hypothetical protein
VTAVSPLTEIDRDPAVSCDTAASCLALVSAKNGVYRARSDIRAQMGDGKATLPVSRLVELVGELGFTAQHFHCDWQWLELAIETRAILLLLKNANVIVAIGPGRLGAQELVVSDPLHDDGEMIVLPRDNLERAWDGDAIAVALRPGSTITPVAPRGLQIADQSSVARSPTRRSTLLFSAIVLCLGFVWLHAARISAPLGEKLAISTTPVERPSTAAPVGSPIINARPADSSSPVTEPPVSEENPIEAPPSAEVPSALYSATASSNPTPPAEATALVLVDPASGVASNRPKLSASDIAILLGRGDDALTTGDITSARLFYTHCAEAGDAGSALRLGETFDPVFLGRTHLPVASSDIGKALFWYRRASDLGSSQARALLKQLDAK